MCIICKIKERERGKTKNIDILDLIEKVSKGRHLLEIEIAEYLGSKAKLFENSYGISLKGINIEFVDITNIESKRPQYIIAQVKFDLGGI